MTPTKVLILKQRLKDLLVDSKKNLLDRDIKKEQREM
jgi:hypothetical protein